MPAVRPELGHRHVCFSCGTKFYDLNREVPTCPNCGADQREAPVVDAKKEALARLKAKSGAAKKGGRGDKRRLRPEDEEELEFEESEDFEGEDLEDEAEPDDDDDDDDDDMSGFDLDGEEEDE